MTLKDLANAVVPHLEHDKEYYLNKYPMREGVVTRFAPSPTGFLHTGSLYMALINYKIAHDADGVFYLRIEDTDTKREVEGSIDTIVSMLKEFGIEFQNDPTYAPYKQSERADIYNAFIYDLILNDKAYPDFVTEEELSSIRESQEKNGERIGYYGKYAVGRSLSIDKMIENINSGIPYVVRAKSSGDFNRKFKFKDLLRGEIEFPENDFDTVIRKRDGLPTYHFAHAIDDTLMHTSIVIRGEEWLNSVPVHRDLFYLLGFKMPKYMHISSILKASEDGTHRKLSKRKDPEASVSFLLEKGYPKKGFINYLLVLANSKYENNMTDSYKLDFKNFSINGSTFDILKLDNVCKEYIHTLSVDDLYAEAYDYASKYDKELMDLINRDQNLFKQILSFEHNPQPRKDYAMYSEIKSKIYYFYNDLFDSVEYEELDIDRDLVKKALDLVLESDFNLDGDSWVASLKEAAEAIGFAKNKKAKEALGLTYMFGDFMKILRVAICKKNESFSIYDVIKLIGIEEAKERINKYLKK